MTDVVNITNCPKCGKTHRYELHVVRTAASSQNNLGDAPGVETFRTRLFHCPIVNEQFQHRFALVHEPTVEIIEVTVQNILDHKAGAASSYLTRVFVSYSRIDQDIVTPIVHIIRAIGLRVFQDIDSIPYGKRWRPIIEDSVTAASTVLVFWCRHAQASQEVRNEWNLAIEANRDVVPALLDDTPMDSLLAEYQAIDLRSLVSGHMGDITTPKRIRDSFQTLPLHLQQRLLEFYGEKHQGSVKGAGIAAARIWRFLEKEATRSG